MAWLTGWDKRIKITADKDLIGSDLSHFPLTVMLSTSAGIGGVDVSCVFDELTSDANSKKIAVTKADGETELYVEIEKWDDANEKAVLHCGITGDTLKTASDTVYYLYYDSGHADNDTYVGDTAGASPATNVWDSNFKAVWHLNNSLLDSSGDGRTLTNDGTDDVDGKMARGKDFVKANTDFLTASDTGLPAVDTARTISFWVNPDIKDSYQYTVTYGTASSNQWFAIQLGIYSQAKYLRVIAFNNDFNSSVQYSTGTWQLITATYDVTTVRMYNNITTDSTTLSDYNTILRGSTGVTIGKYYNGADYLDAVMDEIRISSVARSADWVKADYNSGNDSLLTYGSELIQGENATFFGSNF